MGSCLSKSGKKRNQKGSPFASTDELEDRISSHSSSNKKKEKQDSYIKIKRNPTTDKLEGVPKSWIKKGECDSRIV